MFFFAVTLKESYDLQKYVELKFLTTYICTDWFISFELKGITDRLIKALDWYLRWFNKLNSSMINYI